MFAPGAEQSNTRGKGPHQSKALDRKPNVDGNKKSVYRDNNDIQKKKPDRTKQSQKSPAALHPEEVSAGSTNVSEASIKRALRKSGTPEALATSKLIKRGKVKVNIVDTDPYKMGAAGRGSFAPDKDVYIALDKVKNGRSAAGITTHEAKHILQKVTPSTYRKVHEFEAYKWQREAGFLNMTDQEIIDFINSSPLYKHVPGTLP